MKLFLTATPGSFCLVGEGNGFLIWFVCREQALNEQTLTDLVSATARKI